MADLPALPEELERETPMTKLLYLWLLPQGEVRYSHRQMAEALHVERYQVSVALKRLRELGLVEDDGQPGYKRPIRVREPKA